MTALAARLDPRQLAELYGLLNGAPKAIRMNLAGAINETLKEMRTSTSKRIRGKVNIKKKDVDPHLHIHYAKFSSKAVVTGRLRIEESERLKLKYFGARQTRAGVSYAIMKGVPRKLAGAFGPAGTAIWGPTLGIARLGTQVFLRAGKKRLPLFGPLKGLSAWGAFVTTGMRAPTLDDAGFLLAKNLLERISFILKARAGELGALTKAQSALIGGAG